jgi:hypothetical protein
MSDSVYFGSILMAERWVLAPVEYSLGTRPTKPMNFAGAGAATRFVLANP